MASLGPRSLLSLVRETRAGTRGEGYLVVAGARELVPLLAKALRAGGVPDAVCEQGPLEGAAALVWLGPADERTLAIAAGAEVPIVAVNDGSTFPYVLETDVVRFRPGQGLPVEATARALARALGPRGIGLAARLPVLRPAVIDELIASAARRNGLIAAAVFVPGADLPALTLNELRLVLAVAAASGEEVGIRRAPELLGVLGAGRGSRRLAQRLRELLPLPGFALQGAVAYAATRAIGEAARASFAGDPPLSVRPRT